jgi:hypothetical protein
MCSNGRNLLRAKILPEEQSVTGTSAMAKMAKNSLALTKRYDRLAPIWNLGVWSGKAHTPPLQLALLGRKGSNSGGLG